MHANGYHWSELLEIVCLAAQAYPQNGFPKGFSHQNSGYTHPKYHICPGMDGKFSA